MKYITQVVEANNDIKHVVEVSGQNVFIIEGNKPEPYGNKQDEKVFFANGVKVSRDLMVASNDFNHLAQLVLAVELVRFVIESTGGEA